MNCTYPGCTEPMDERTERYMHETTCTVYPDHPHNLPRSMAKNENFMRMLDSFQRYADRTGTRIVLEIWDF